MSDMKCTHKKGGDTINGNWVCSQCFQKLHERPPFYYSQPVGVRGDGEVSFRQAVSYTPIARCDGLSLSQFINAMALRFVSRTKGAMSLGDATNYAILLMQDFDAEFGCEDYAWDEGAAFELADEDMQYWDADTGGSNS